MTRVTRSDDGFTMVEIVFAMLVSMLTVVATVALLSKGSGTTLSNIRQVTMTQALRSEIEKVRTIVPQSGFSAVALSSLPTGTGSTVADPRFWLRNSGTKLVIAQNYLDPSSAVAAGSASGGEKIVTGGQVAPVSTNVSLGSGQTATIYRFITDDSQMALCAPACADDARRVTIAIVPSATDGNSTDVRGPFWLSTVITNEVPNTTVAGGNGLELGVAL